MRFENVKKSPFSQFTQTRSLFSIIIIYCRSLPMRTTSTCCITFLKFLHYVVAENCCSKFDVLLFLFIFSPLFSCVTLFNCLIDLSGQSILTGPDRNPLSFLFYFRFLFSIMPIIVFYITHDIRVKTKKSTGNRIN